jgi:hypothetical protein
MLTTWTSSVDQRPLARRFAVLAFTVALAISGVAMASQADAAGRGDGGGVDNPASVRWR